MVSENPQWDSSNDGGYRLEELSSALDQQLEDMRLAALSSNEGVGEQGTNDDEYDFVAEYGKVVKSVGFWKRLKRLFRG